ncbi:hypothetical protein [uncultured Corynebacterium sp.]|uniref:hypothetical protein n=1 Tax=uncultured Corynebacterium sp. TaxID=159447 RepID=UPI002599E202|nr:hypothetical protein [uncultured Corynebacterium sp.]
MDTIYKNPDGAPRGPWTFGEATANHEDNFGVMCYAIQSPITGEILRPPAGCSWRYSQQRMLQSLQEWASYKLENLKDHE